MTVNNPALGLLLGPSWTIRKVRLTTAVARTALPGCWNVERRSMPALSAQLQPSCTGVLGKYRQVSASEKQEQCSATQSDCQGCNDLG